ncbi:Proline-specific permease-like protein [Hapsidospora chrysogenum ATCC 11550]|uniref:Proline-specific permease-like protein n=1 Tax=Hapsidospora chrysogenum (strain ATCC 11550 / CBS 779.69 / DSM 880 / IAM 14645 / JCM 23072 / IMI 49137) TaxID=857340 RepID=A0A086T5L3_HAPC1|nr:Proline-specific permease-like protein [Hapsidospora chrysogenum ATCC 11550]
MTDIDSKIYRECGSSLASAGPGGALMAYIIIGIVVSSVMSSLGEMTALMPVNAPMMEFPRRFLDRGVGFAVGWIYWFAYAVIAANQLVASTNAIRFRYDDGTTFLNWPTGENVDHAVWFGMVLVAVTMFNMLPVRIYGELEYVFGSIKMLILVMTIFLLLVIDTMKPPEPLSQRLDLTTDTPASARPGAYYDEPPGVKYWNDPYSFFRNGYNVTNGDGSTREITGSAGSLLGVWTTFINVAFSYVGMDIFAATAAESRILANSEGMKMAARKINIRVVTIYAFAVLLASFVVPTDHPFINGGGQSVGSRSVFLIAVVEAGMPAAAHFYNSVFLFSSFTCAINSMYNASRVMHTLALRGQTGPEFITRRLRQCRSGVPTRTVLVTAGMMLIGFLGRSGAPGSRLDELANNCTVSFLIAYGTICATYLCFYRTLREAKMYGNTSEAQAASYDRNNPAYPYKSHGQWLKAAFGLMACVLILLFNGVAAFLRRPFGVRTFISSYISDEETDKEQLPVFLLLIVGYKIRNHGFTFSEWGPERSEDLSNTVQVTTVRRKGRLEPPDEAYFTKANALATVRWLWEWLQ